VARGTSSVLQPGVFPGRIEAHGLRELDRDLGKISRAVQKELRLELREVAEPVAAEVRGLAQHEHWGPRTVSGIAAGSRLGTAVVRQRRKKVTGKRADFGALQMRKAFLPAVIKMEPVVKRRVEQMLDRLTSKYGFGRGGVL
jgi:hypothetical protein